MDKEEAVKATRNGAIAALISAAMTLAIVLVATQGGASETLAYYNDPWIFADVGLLVILAFFVWRKSRVAAVILLGYFLISQFISRLETGNARGLFVSLIFVYFYIKAIQGAFTYHRLERDENPEYKATRWWHFLVGVPVLIVVLGVLAFGFGSSVGIFPATYVQAGHEVRLSDVEVLQAQGIINEDDKIEFFYSEGAFSILEGGQLLVQDRIIVYTQNEEDELEMYELYFEDITSIEMWAKGDLFSDGEYKIIGADEDAWVWILLSTEDDGDERFIEALLSHVSAELIDRTGLPQAGT